VLADVEIILNADRSSSENGRWQVQLERHSSLRNSIAVCPLNAYPKRCGAPAPQNLLNGTVLRFAELWVKGIRHPSSQRPAGDPDRQQDQGDARFLPPPGSPNGKASLHHRDPAAPARGAIRGPG
jgi:hypothetical protein